MGQNRRVIVALFNLRGNYIAKLTISLSGQRQPERAMLTQSYTERVSAPRECEASRYVRKVVERNSTGVVRRAARQFAGVLRTCFVTAWLWSKRPRPISTAPGRQQSKKLERAAALAYATESMRLTTRLMQLASWLLLHRAVKEGEMSLAQASKEKSKVKLASRGLARCQQYRAAAGAAARTH